MSSENVIELKTFPIVKIISAALFIVGAILAYIFASQPEIMLMQIGGIPHNLILGIFPLLSGLVLLLYAFLTYYKTEIIIENDTINMKSKKNEISIQKDELQAVRVRDAGKFFVWFVFFFVNFYFVYYGIETGLYFSANHYAGSFEYIIYALFVVWLGGLCLILFPRRLVILLTKDKAIVQKVNHLPKDGSFHKTFDKIFGFNEDENSRFNQNNHIFLRLMIGIAFLLIFIVLHLILVEIDGIYQPYHDLGIFIPIFLLLFSVLMISTILNAGFKQNVTILNNVIRVEESSLNSSLKGKAYSWYKAKENISDNNFSRGFRKLTVYDLLLIFIMSGQAIFLVFKFFWLPLYFTYLDWRDILFGVLILIALFLYQFEIMDKLNIDIDSKLSLVREIYIPNPNEIEKAETERNIVNSIKKYFQDFRSLAKRDNIKHFLKVGLTYIAAIVIITLTFSVLGFILPLFI